MKVESEKLKVDSEELTVDSGPEDTLSGVERAWPAMPTETEIYILPDGRVVVADMPMELAEAMMLLGEVQPCEVQGAEVSEEAI